MNSRLEPIPPEGHSCLAEGRRGVGVVVWRVIYDVCTSLLALRTQMKPFLRSLGDSRGLWWAE